MRAPEDKQPQVTQKRFATDITPLVYDLQFRPDAPDVPFWVDLCRDLGGPVLEPDCGNGRVAIPLARAGLGVVGIDVSELMLAVARRRRAEESADVRRRVHLVKADMCEYKEEAAFGSAIIPVSTFSVLLTRDDQDRTLSNIRASLKESACLALELRVFDDWLGRPPEPPVRRTSADGDVDFTEERRFEFDSSARLITSINTYRFRSPKHLGVITETQTGRVLSRPEAHEILESSGFTVEAVWGEYDHSPFQADSARMIFVARKAR